MMGRHAFLLTVWLCTASVAIEVRAGIAEAYRATSRYNHNVAIEGNTFRLYDEGPIVSAYSVDGLTVRNNRVVKTDAYPPRKIESEPFDITHCDRVVVEGNTGWRMEHGQGAA